MNAIQVNLNDPEPPFKKVKQEQKEPEESGVKLNDLPELPFEKILSYLSLEDLIKARAVSRRWYSVVNSFRPKSLCVSKHPTDFLCGKSRWINGSNFIGSSRFKSFFQTFGQTILSSLKHLHLYSLVLNANNVLTDFAQILNSFDKLEELVLFSINPSSKLGRGFQLHLNLPMLKSVQLVHANEIKKLILNAPRLQDAKLFCSPKVDLVHCESVEKLIIYFWDDMEVKKLNNLKYLYCGHYSSIDSTLLSTLEQLKEIHLSHDHHVPGIFEQKHRYGRSNLMIFLCGCLLDGPNDPAIESLAFYNERYLVCLAENQSRLAEAIPFCEELYYRAIEAVAPGQETDLLNRFVDLGCIKIDRRVQNVERFLNLPKNLNNMISIDFEDGDQPQQLFDRLPDCAIQSLEIQNASRPADLDFLFRLKSLVCLDLCFPIDINLIPKVLKELPFLSCFLFEYLNKVFTLEIDGPNQFKVSLVMEQETKLTSDLNAAIEWICEKGIELEDKE